MRDFEFNFNCLLSCDGSGERTSIFEVLHKLSHALRLKKGEFRTLLRRLENDAHWSPSPESKLKMMARQASPLDRARLKDTRGETNSSMEILSDLLVSSIIDEVTGKAASTAVGAAAAAPGSPGGGPSSPAAAFAAEDDRGHAAVVDQPDAAPCRAHLFGALLEAALLQISTMQHLAGKVMLTMASSRFLDPTLQISLSRFMQARAFLSPLATLNIHACFFITVQECVRTLSREGVPQPPVKRRLPAAEVERAFSVVRSNPEQRRKLEHGEEVDEIETDVGKEVRLDVVGKVFRDLKLVYRPWH